MPTKPDTPGPRSATSSGPGADEGHWATSRLVPLAIIAVAVGLIGAIIVFARQEQDDGRAVLAAAAVDSATLPISVPYREVAGAVVIDVTLGNSDRSVPMLLDTGAPTIVSGQIAETYGTGLAGTVSAASIDGQVVTSDVVALPRLAIGGAVFSTVGAVVGELEPGNPFACLSEAGFIGANLMRTAVWQLDPVAGVVTIAPSVDGLDHIDGADRFDLLPASDISPSPLIEVPLGEGTLTTLLDTGSNGWLAAHPDDLGKLGVAIPDDAPAMAILGTTAGGASVARARWVDAERGRAVLPVAAMELLSPGQAVAGMDYLSRYVVTVDWPGGAVYLDPIATVAPSTPASASLAWDDGFVVGSYVEGLPANDGLQLAAPVLAIDDEIVSDAPFDRFCRHLTQPPERMVFTLEADHAETVPVAPVEDLFARFER